MTKYLYINESVDVDLKIDLRDHVKDIIKFIETDEEIQHKLQNLKIIPKPELEREEGIIKNNPFKLSSEEFNIHMSYTSIDSTRIYLQNHLLIKDNRIVGIITTNGHILIITSDEKNIIDLIHNYEVSMKSISLSNNLAINKKIELDLIDGEVLQHVSIKDDFSVKNNIIDQDHFRVDILANIIINHKDIELKPFQNDYKSEDGHLYDLIYLENKKFNASYINDIKTLASNNDPFYYYLLEDKIMLKNNRNYVLIMSVRN